jgi:hypothetical protein
MLHEVTTYTQLSYKLNVIMPFTKAIFTHKLAKIKKKINNNINNKIRKKLSTF